MRVTKKIDFCVGHRLLQYTGPCANIHGHNISLEASFEIASNQGIGNWSIGTPPRINLTDGMNKSGFIVDFKDVKTLLKTWVDDNLDHGFVANCFDEPTVRFMDDMNMKTFVMPDLYPGYAKSKRIQLCNPTMENLSLVIGAICIESANIININSNRDSVTFHSLNLFESNTGWVTTDRRDVIDNAIQHKLIGKLPYVNHFARYHAPNQIV